MMWNTMENHEERERIVAVAVDKDKTSQYALKWATEHVLGRHQIVKLIHVIQRSPSNNNLVMNDEEELTEQQQPADIQTMDVFLPFRCFCNRRHIQCELVVLERPDVARALIEYVSQYGVESLLLGSPSKNGLTRLFKVTDIPATVMKWAPEFCNVYVVSKGKCNAIRFASRPVPPLHPPCTPRTPQHPPPNFLRSYDEYPTSETDLSCMNSERTSTDSTFFAFYENLEFNLNPSTQEYSSRPLNLIDHHHHELLASGQSTMPPVDLTSLPELSSNSMESSGRTSSASQNREDMEEEIKLLKRELRQTMEMYDAACKEALATKEKARELEEWKMREERRSKEAEMREEREKAKCRAAREAAEAAQKIIKLEVERRVSAEMKAVKEGEEKTKVLDALGHSQTLLKHQSLFHILVVLFLFYCYFSVFFRTF